MDAALMDTTLRDGEHTTGVAFVPEEKLNIARMLLWEVNIDREDVERFYGRCHRKLDKRLDVKLIYRP